MHGPFQKPTALIAILSAGGLGAFMNNLLGDPLLAWYPLYLLQCRKSIFMFYCSVFSFQPAVHKWSWKLTESKHRIIESHLFIKSFPITCPHMITYTFYHSFYSVQFLIQRRLSSCTGQEWNDLIQEEGWHITFSSVTIRRTEDMT